MTMMLMMIIVTTERSPGGSRSSGGWDHQDSLGVQLSTTPEHHCDLKILWRWQKTSSGLELSPLVEPSLSSRSSWTLQYNVHIKQRWREPPRNLSHPPGSPPHPHCPLWSGWASAPPGMSAMRSELTIVTTETAPQPQQHVPSPHYPQYAHQSPKQCKVLRDVEKRDVKNLSGWYWYERCWTKRW